jgi:hypothetical protein
MGQEDAGPPWLGHVTALCRTESIEWLVAEDTGDEGWSDLDDRLIRTGPLTSRLRYFTALHEIAHIALALPGSDVYEEADIVLDHEAQAWLWALDHAQDTWDETVAADIAAGMHDYAQGYTCHIFSPAVIELAHRLEERFPSRHRLVLGLWHRGQRVPRVVCLAYPRPGKL